MNMADIVDSYVERIRLRERAHRLVFELTAMSFPQSPGREFEGSRLIIAERERKDSINF